MSMYSSIDNILAILCEPRKILNTLEHFLFKPESIGAPTFYLNASISRYTIPGDGRPK